MNTPSWQNLLGQLNAKALSLPVRQAISYAIDRSSVINAAGGSALAESATTYLPNQKSFGYTPYDLFPAGKAGNAAKAKETVARGFTELMDGDIDIEDTPGGGTTVVISLPVAQEPSVVA